MLFRSALPRPKKIKRIGRRLWVPKMKTLLKYITPVLIIICVGLLNRYLDIKMSKKINGPLEYRYPLILTYMLCACLLAPLLLFIAPESVVEDARPQFLFMGICGSLLISISIFYCKLYAITIEPYSIRFGAFLKNEIRYESIRAVKYHWVNNGRYIKLTLATGQSKTFEKGVEDFDGLAKAIYQRLNKSIVAFSATGKASFV